jgi:3-oxoacyl-[acyl-carrier protein] reductase
MTKLAGRVALVTGGARGLGAAAARALAGEGAKVVVSDIGDGSETAASIGGAYVKHDVTSEADWSTAIDFTKRTFGGLDILVNNAGVSHVNKSMLEIGEDEFDRVFAVNVKGVFLFSQAAVPAMRARGGGVIINIGSTAGLRPRPGLSAYNATKGAVHNLTKTLAVELAPDKIRVCAIAPVATDTPLLPTFLGNAEGQREKFIATVPLGRLAMPQDIADMALFLASEEAKFLTGNIVEVDGGRCV